MVQYKLYYFNAKGRAELARFVFAAAGQEYEDVRIEREQWPTEFKPKMPTGTVPCLEVHDGSSVFKMSQSVSIARFLAKRFNLAGSTDLEQAEVDMYADQVGDLLNEMVKVHFEPDETKKAALHAKMQTETVPNSLKIFEAKLNQTNSGYLVASGLTWADLFLFNILEWIGDKKAAALEHFPALKKHNEAIGNHPRIAKWIETRPVTAM